MSGYLEIRQWIGTRQAAYAVDLLAGGQYIAVGTEQGLELFDVTGRRHLAYPQGEIPLPIHQLAAADEGNGEDCLFLGPLYVAARQRGIVRLNLERDQPDEQFRFQVQTLYESPGDLYSLSFSAPDDLLAVGHLTPGLALLDDEGHFLWRRHPDDGTATQGQTWSVALDGEGDILYVGSAGKGTNWLAALETRSGLPRAHRRLGKGERATSAASLPKGKGVVVALSESMSTGRLAAYSPELNELLWEHFFDEQVTALTVDPQQPILAIGVGYAGQVVVIDAQEGRILASGLYLKSVINGLAMDQGQTLAAATQDGQLALIHYQSEEFRL